VVLVGLLAGLHELEEHCQLMRCDAEVTQGEAVPVAATSVGQHVLFSTGYDHKEVFQVHELLATAVHTPV
jgi:hypothetical protein